MKRDVVSPGVDPPRPSEGETTMREWHNQGHVRWYCRYHIIIVPKYRQKGDCSEGTGLPPEDVYRTVRVRTIEPGGPHNVWSRGIPPRSKRRDHRTRRPAPARDRPLQSQRPPATVSTLWVLGLSGQAVSSDAA